MLQNHERLTKEFCHRKTLLFFPCTVGEARLIQQNLFAMGFQWAKGLGNSIQFEEVCVKGGMVLDQDGVLWTNPGMRDVGRGRVCTADQFDPGYKSDRELMMEMFNKLSAQVKALEERMCEQGLCEPLVRKLPPAKPGKDSR